MQAPDTAAGDAGLFANAEWMDWLDQIPRDAPWFPFVWLGGAALGYLLLMATNPLRGYLGDSYDMLRERGHGILVVAVAVLSLGGLALDWWQRVPGEWPPQWGRIALPALQADPARALDATVAPLTSVFGLCVAGSDLGFGPGARNIVITSVTGLLAVAVGFVVQFVLLLFLYLRATIPGRPLKIGNLVDLAVRRTGTLWPALIACWILWTIPVALRLDGWLRAGWSLGVAALLTAFAFLQVAVLGKNRPLREAVAVNFASWRRRGRDTLWFAAVACVHGLLLFLVAEVLRGSIPAGTWLALAGDVAFSFIRAFVVVWLMGTWVILWSD